jgi:D-alanyl-D-alanine carboxypeptidase
MRMRKLILSWSLLLAVSTIMTAQSTTQARLDSLFDAMAAGGKTMGSICISQGGQVLYTRAIGYSQIDGTTKTPATDKSKYRIASITKMFTAAMIFQLIDESELELTTTLDNYFPKMPNAKDITIGQMLSHRSGIHNILDDPNWSSWKVNPKTRDEMVAMISKYPPDFTPGSKASYSNSNYILLGYIIEDICDKPYKKVVHDRIISKCGMKNTYYGDKTDPDKGECYSYAYENTWVRQPEADMSILGGAGGLVSTPTDLNKFIQTLYAGKLIRQNYLDEMQNITDGYGMGMESFVVGNHTSYGHNGAIDGFSSLLEYFPDDDIAISYLSNGEADTVNDIVNAALAIVFDNPVNN